MNPRTRSMPVLLIEDDPGDAGLVTQMLERSKSIETEVTHVERVAAARAALHQQGFECVLLDLGLPDARGLEALKLVITAAPDAAIVVLTGQEDEEMGLQALHEGAQDYLSKNKVDGEILARAIRYAVERKRVEATKRHFLDNAAHELRTPLAIISGAAEILELHKKEIEPERFDELIAVIAKQGRKVSTLLSQLLELSALDEAGREGIEAVDVSGLIGATMENLTVPEEKSIEHMVEEGLKAWAHPDRLRHILDHLVQNAFRYGGKSVSVDAAANDGRIKIGVSDDGPGIPDDLRFQLFEPFGRGSLWHPAGSGLGLAICQRMAKSFDAEIGYRPQRPHGARFELTLRPA